MSLKECKDKLMELKRLAGEAGEALFRRVGMVRELLEDREFVQAEFGDWETARDALHQDCFPDLSMAMTLDQLLTLYRWFPDAAKWREYKFNLRRLWAQYVEEDNKKKREEKRESQRQHRPTKEDFERQKEDMTHLQYMLKRRDVDVDERDRRIGELVRENVELKNQLAAARKEAADLRRKLEKAARAGAEPQLAATA